MALSPGAAAILQARRQYSTRPPETDPPEVVAKPKPSDNGGMVTGAGAGAGNIYRPPGVDPNEGAAPTPAVPDALGRMQRMNGYRAQHAQFNAGRRVYGHNNGGTIPTYDPTAWLPGQRPDQTPGTGSYADANAPRTPAGTTGAPTPMGAGNLTSPAGTAAGTPNVPAPNAPGPNHPGYAASLNKPLNLPGKSGSDRHNTVGLRQRLGLI